MFYLILGIVIGLVIGGVIGVYMKDFVKSIYAHFHSPFFYHVQCHKCKKYVYILNKYCSTCGAKQEGGLKRGHIKMPPDFKA